MSEITTNTNIPKFCGECVYNNCTKWRNRKWDAPPPDDCPIKSTNKDCGGPDS